MSVERISPLSRLELAHKKATRLVDEQRKISRRLDEFFLEIAAVVGECRDAGSSWKGPVLDGHVQAAFEAWQDGHQALDVDPIPLMELEP